MWYKHNFFKYATGIILCLLIIYLLGKVEYFISPIKQFIAILFFPIIISGLLYYILRPVVRWLDRFRMPRTLSIVVVISVFTALVILAGVYSCSIVISQFSQLMSDFPRILNAADSILADVLNWENLNLIPFDMLRDQILSFSKNTIGSLSYSILGLISTLTGIATVLLLVPFILFYLLKDDHLFAGFMLKIVPEEHKKNGKEVLEDIDRTLSAYIISMVIVALFIGVLMYIGYLLTGLDYAFVLALFAAVTSIVPLVGTVLGILPAVLVGLPGGLLVLIKILIITSIVQTIQGNVISPLIMGKSLDIHPLTYIMIFLVSASLYGFIGLLVAVPLYAVLKVTIGNLYRMYRLRKLSQ